MVLFYVPKLCLHVFLCCVVLLGRGMQSASEFCHTIWSMRKLFILNTQSLCSHLLHALDVKGCVYVYVDSVHMLNTNKTIFCISVYKK